MFAYRPRLWIFPAVLGSSCGLRTLEAFRDFQEFEFQPRQIRYMKPEPCHDGCQGLLADTGSKAIGTFGICISILVLVPSLSLGDARRSCAVHVYVLPAAPHHPAATRLSRPR